MYYLWGFLMHLPSRYLAHGVAVCAIAFALCGCATTRGQAIGQPAEFSGKIVGPLEFGQPEEGAGLKAYGLQLASPVKLDDKADCGEQMVSVFAVESPEVAKFVGKTVVLKATAFCRVSRSGKYHLKDVSVQ